MSRTYRQVCKQEQHIQKGMANNWGYDLNNVIIDVKEKKQKEACNLVVANITLRKFNKEIQKTQKIKQIQDEIKALENQKMLRQIKQTKFKETDSSQKSEIIQLMEKIIYNYNQILQHKHLTQKMTFQGTSKTFKPQKMNQASLIIQQINAKKKRLGKADLTEQVKINRQLTQLYREYKESLNKKPKENVRESLIMNHSNMLEPTLALKLNKLNSEHERLEQYTSVSQRKKIQSLKFHSNQNISKESLRKSNAFQINFSSNDILGRSKDLQLTRKGSRNRKNSSYMSKRQSRKGSDQYMSKHTNNSNIQKDLSQPYLQKKQLEAYKMINQKIRGNNEALQLWKTRIDEACNSSFVNKSARNKQKQIQLQKMKEENQILKRAREIEGLLDSELKIMKFQDSDQSKNSQYKSDVLKKKKKNDDQKQKIFASILKKRHSKFNKLWGTKILVKYNSQMEAKMMLKGEGEKNPNKIAGRGNSAQQKHTLSQRQASKNTSRKFVGQSLTERQNVNTSFIEEIDWRAEQKDQEHYWRMCKNEKINLLFKRK